MMILQYGGKPNGAFTTLMVRLMGLQERRWSKPS
jgi:hypothetical protein